MPSTHPLVGLTVRVNGINGCDAGLGKIAVVSPTAKRITLDHKGHRRAFYRVGESNRWVFEPGCGMCGSMLNDSFTLSPETITILRAFWAAQDAAQRLPAPPRTKSCRVEAYGVRGFQSKPWRKVFRSRAALLAWAEKYDADIHATREVGP